MNRTNHRLDAFAPALLPVMDDLIGIDGRINMKSLYLGPEQAFADLVWTTKSLSETGLTKFARHTGNPFFAVTVTPGLWVCITIQDGVELFLATDSVLYTVKANNLPTSIEDILKDCMMYYYRPVQLLGSLYTVSPVVREIRKIQLVAWLKTTFTDEYAEFFRKFFMEANPYQVNDDPSWLTLTETYARHDDPRSVMWKKLDDPDGLIVSFGLATFGFRQVSDSAYCYVFDEGEGRMFELFHTFPDLSRVVKNLHKAGSGDAQAYVSAFPFRWRKAFGHLLLADGAIDPTHFLLEPKGSYADSPGEARVRFEERYRDAYPTYTLWVGRTVFMFVQNTPASCGLIIYDVASKQSYLYLGEITATLDDLFG